MMNDASWTIFWVMLVGGWALLIGGYQLWMGLRRVGKPTTWLGDIPLVCSRWYCWRWAMHLVSNRAYCNGHCP